jgi:hypothetical protein
MRRYEHYPQNGCVVDGLHGVGRVYQHGIHTANYESALGSASAGIAANDSG